MQPTLTFCNIAKCPIQLRRPSATLWTDVPLPHHAAPCLTPGLPLTPGGRACSRARMPVFTYVLICAFRGHPYVVLAGMVNFPSHTCQLPSSPAASDVMTATAAWACELWGRIVLSLPILLEKFMLVAVNLIMEGSSKGSEDGRHRRRKGDREGEDRDEGREEGSQEEAPARSCPLTATVAN